MGFRHEYFQQNGIRIGGGQNRKLILSNQVLYFSDISIVGMNFQAYSLLPIQNDGGFQSLLYGARIGADQSSGAKKGAAEIAGDDNTGIVNIFAQKHVQHGASGSSGRLSVVAAARQLMAAADGKSRAVVSGVPILLFDLLYKALGFFFRFDRGDSGDETGFLFDQFSCSALPGKTV